MEALIDTIINQAKTGEIGDGKNIWYVKLQGPFSYVSYIFSLFVWELRFCTTQKIEFRGILFGIIV